MASATPIRQDSVHQDSAHQRRGSAARRLSFTGGPIGQRPTTTGLAMRARWQRDHGAAAGLRWACLTLIWLATACHEPLDRAEPALPRPTSLPAVGGDPVAPAQAARARDHADEANTALQRKDLTAAAAAATLACTLDPSDALPRLELARIYVRAGLGSVALQLLQTAYDAGAACGTCVEALIAARADPELAPLWASREASDLHSAIADLALPWAKWAADAAAAIAAFDGKAFERLAHPDVTFDLVRVCPTCPSIDKRTPESRTLRGPLMLAKIAGRFDARVTPVGALKLQVPTLTGCAERCCSFAATPAPTAEAARLDRICLRPLRADAAVLTGLTLHYASTLPTVRAPPLAAVATPTAP